jgi:N-acetylglucosamine malate deacetylase 1
MTTPAPAPDEVSPVDLLAVGAHPDDVEYGMGGTLVRHHRAGYSIGVVDLTRGELGSKGTPDGRGREARHAAEVYGAAWRATLDLGDNQVTADVASVRRLARLVRIARPRLVFTHHDVDRHPDHRAAHELVRRAVFAAGLRNLDLGATHHPGAQLLFFPTDGTLERADVMVDVTAVWQERLETMRRFASQFTASTLEIDHAWYGVTDYLEATEARSRVHGQRVGVRHAEAFIAQREPVADDLVALMSARGD